MPGRFFRYIILILFMGTFSLDAGEFQAIFHRDKRIEYGYKFYNKYCQIVFLNPSVHSGHITTGDFDVMRRTDTQNRPTLDDKIAKIRIFFKPDVSARTAERRAARIHGDADWSMQQFSDGMKYSRKFSKDNYSLAAEVTVQMPPERACLEFEYVVQNTGTEKCTVDVSGIFNFLRNDVEPLQLILEREMVRYKDGQKESFISNTITELNGKMQTYWWRRVVRDSKIFGNYFNRETIPFNQPRLVPPQLFGFSKLAGSGVLIWETAEDSKLDELDVSWDSEHAEAIPGWKFTLAAGEKRIVKFRLVTVKGLPRFDSVTENWIFGFAANGDHLQVAAVPLEAQDRLSMNFTISDPRNQVLINQRNEMPASTPFLPAKFDLRAMMPFQPNVGYAFKLSVGSLDDDLRLLETSGNMTP